MRMSDEALRGIIEQLRARIEEEESGPRAELRRATYERPWSAALWRLLATHIWEDAWAPTEATRAEEERRWAVLLAAMAASSSLGMPAEASLGQTLADAHYSELRLNRLLRAQEHTLLNEVRAMAAYLESHSTAVRWADVGVLLLRDPEGASGEGIRRQIARSYYGALHKAQST